MPSTQQMVLRPTRREELESICRLDQGEARTFIISYSLERYLLECAKPGVIYRPIEVQGQIIGCVILIFHPDGRSVEFRRIVVTPQIEVTAGKRSKW